MRFRFLLYSGGTFVSPDLYVGQLKVMMKFSSYIIDGKRITLRSMCYRGLPDYVL